MEFGRIHCVVVATKAGEVVYERYYDRYTELDKAEIRAAFQQATDSINLANDNQDFVGAFRCVMRPITSPWDSCIIILTVIRRGHSHLDHSLHQLLHQLLLLPTAAAAVLQGRMLRDHPYHGPCILCLGLRRIR
jgi:hypothetical protein